ncbi:MAG: response regulator [Thermodesulfobacteriota bacterium]|nr:response regulator [Thermodesulfobacteriota bacterium]
MPENKELQEKIKQLEEEIRILKLKSIERRQLEEQLYQVQKMEALASLSGGLAHDFNNILHCILGYTEMAMMGKPKDDPDYETFRQIEMMIDKGSELARQFLAFGRKIPLNFKPIDLNLVIPELMNLLRRTIPKMIAIELKLGENLKMINADAGQCEQILMNLSINAVNAMGKNGKLTFLTEHVVLDPDHPQTLLNPSTPEYFCLTISDTGHGMSPQILNRMYEPFFTTKDKGNGLGLSIVYSIVKDHGGFIECNSNVGRGTTFKIYFPVINGDAKLEKKLVPKKTDKALCGNERILIVDDEEDVLKISKEILVRNGYTVITAKSGEEGIIKYSENFADLVLLDIGMPGMGGINCLQKLMSVDSKVKVVIMSGYSGDKNIEEARKLGAKAFLQKPYHIAGLLNTIRSVLDNYSCYGWSAWPSLEPN